MKILFTVSECVPFVKTGGLADVVGALAPVLAEKGHDVRVMLPKYAAIPENYVNQMNHVVDFEVELGWRRQYCGIEQLDMNGVTFYFVDNRYYFGRNYIYGLGGDEYERFAFFSRAVLNALPLIGFKPDILHAHDWQAGLIPVLLNAHYAALPAYSGIKTVMTIHNLQYQGIFGIKEVQDVLGLEDAMFTNDKLECFGAANFLKGGIVYSDEITTVSPSYAEEIQTAYYGERLDGLLRAKKAHVTGVLNGIDMQEYDPMEDGSIARTYSIADISGKADCKRALQEQLGLQQRPDVPIIAMVGRLSNQKGLDLVDYVIADIMREEVQLVCLGMGDSRYVNLFSWAEQNYPGRVAARFVMDHQLAHQIYAGADMFLMPSQYEPCGLSQMIAMRYGTIPLVRETGGLRDTVLSYNEFTGSGNGFSFFNYNAHDMLHTIQRALHYYFNKKDVWQILQERGMNADFSWEQSAETYINIYHGLLNAKAAESGKPTRKPPVKKSAAKDNKPSDDGPAKNKATEKKTPAKKAARPKEAN
ncbi:MAG: glycogen synthase GlgA [Eubacteriales bacterium]|nr:glycogen synthase GlgA [Eubacteriales bacterium]MDD4105909.1 glycogen synthase GlgA [Eubacteriales bacterium]MDD4711152.1 glycogen synthase GlgA [Eubacteriales bacterium]NLO15693.1 glycogen synthase GlgA [Clostridiales bacterium]